MENAYYVKSFEVKKTININIKIQFIFINILY